MLLRMVPGLICLTLGILWVFTASTVRGMAGSGIAIILGIALTWSVV